MRIFSALEQTTSPNIHWAVGRDDATVSEYYILNHPALLRLLGIIIQEAGDKSVTICGEVGVRKRRSLRFFDWDSADLASHPPLMATKDLIRSLSVEVSSLRNSRSHRLPCALFRRADQPWQMKRCRWAESQLMIAYHDQEWGRPQHHDRMLFEFLILEGAQVAEPGNDLEEETKLSRSVC